jgi:hypothetical protein
MAIGTLTGYGATLVLADGTRVPVRLGDVRVEPLICDLVRVGGTWETTDMPPWEAAPVVRSVTGGTWLGEVDAP